MSENKETHSSAKEAHEIAPMLEFLIALGENCSNTPSIPFSGISAPLPPVQNLADYKFLKPFIPEMKNEIRYIYDERGHASHKIADMEIGKYLYKNSPQDESDGKNYGCDFSLTIPDVLPHKIYFEVTECLDKTAKAAWETSKFRENLPNGIMHMPSPRAADIPNSKKAMKAEICRYTAETNLKSPRPGWNDNMASAAWSEYILTHTIHPKITGQKLFPNDNSESMFLIVRSNYHMEGSCNPCELLSELIWKAGHRNLKNFSPFTNLIIIFSFYIAVFRINFSHRHIWKNRIWGTAV